MGPLGIITYNTCHLKTEQQLLQLAGRYDMRVYALPYVQRTARKTILQHHPDQSAVAPPRSSVSGTACRIFWWKVTRRSITSASCI